MNGDEEVGLVSVGYVGTSMKGNEHVGLSGVDDFDIGTVALHILAKGQRYLQIDVFLVREGSLGTGIVAAVPRVDDERKLRVCCP